MSQKYRVLNVGEDVSSSRIPEYLRKSEAQTWIRRGCVDLVAYRVIRRRAMRHPDAHIRPVHVRPPRAEYQHHIEPRLERLNEGNSAWLAYLNGTPVSIASN